MRISDWSSDVCSSDLKAHIPGSLHIENGKSFSTWVGSLIDYQHQIVLLTDENHMADLTRKMMRIGMDNIYGFVISLNKLNVALEKCDLANIRELRSDERSVVKVCVSTCNSRVLPYIITKKNK